ncbi:hypothetical protein [Hoeflea sp.]|uniref:hypothetical protein n=1 Tax=Hoeflea sp. TaxID=1940281 RepID=UPI003B0220C9
MEEVAHGWQLRLGAPDFGRDMKPWEAANTKAGNVPNSQHVLFILVFQLTKSLGVSLLRTNPHPDWLQIVQRTQECV